jgi:hypothetical protein
MTKLVFWTAAIACLVSSSIAQADKIYRAGRGATWDCKQDPVVSILHGNGKYTFTGTCKSITLTGGNNTLTIATTDSISITGAHNKIAIDTVDAINIVGSHNTVTYKGAANGDKPSVSQIGTNNVITGGGGGGGKADSKPSEGAKPDADSDSDDDPPAGAQNCAKNPTAEINTGAGNYEFVGPCTKIIVNGGDNKLKIESVKELSISGSLNTVAVGSVDKIAVPGGENKVTYRKGIAGAKPKISSVGTNNTITQIK